MAARIAAARRWNVQGQNLAIEFRWADRRNDRLPAIPADLIRPLVVVIATRAARMRRSPQGALELRTNKH